MKQALVIMPAWIGDSLLAQPLLRRIEERYPGILLDALTPDWTAGLVARMPEIRRVIASGLTHGPLALRERIGLGRRLAATGYEAAWVLPNSFKSGLIPWFAGIGLRIGYTGEARYGLINQRHILRPDALPLMVARYAQLAEVPGEPVRQPILTSTLRVDFGARDALCERFGLSPGEQLIGLCPGAEYGPAKRWPVAHFALLARNIVGHAARVVIFGSARDGELGAHIESACADLPRGAIVNLCGRTRLDEALDLMSLMSAVVANDTGLMHLAAGLRRPLVALYGSSSPMHTPPLDDSARIVWNRIECSPCYERTCPLGHFRCMNELQVQQVEDALSAQLARSKPLAGHVSG